MRERRLSRRDFLLVSASTAVGMLLAACGGGQATEAPATAAPSQATEVPTKAGAQPTSAQPTTVPAEGSAGTSLVPVEGEPWVNHLFATVEEYESATGKAIDSFGESPMMTALVKSGDLPPLEERLPKDVAVVRPRDYIGQYTEQLRLLGTNDEDVGWTHIVEDTNQNLTIFDPELTDHAAVAKGWELAKDGKSLTIYLREGMKWSDGDGFDAKDFVFWYEDLQKNPDITPTISSRYKPGGELMGLNVIDDYTVQYTFAVPYYRAPEVLVRSLPAAPEHFLKRYMPKYSDAAEALVEQEGYESWPLAVQFHWGHYAGDTLLPVVNPWVLKEYDASSALWERNPYFWRVDTAGNQLPYADKLLVSMVADGPARAMKMMSGEIDFLDYIALTLTDYPVLKKSEEQRGYKVYLWRKLTESTAMGFALEYCHKDPVLRGIFNDLRFRQALSLAINRDEISENIFYGMTEPWTAPFSSAWTGYEDWMGTYYAEHDVDKANALLDEMGLKWDAAHEYRLRPDGSTLYILGEWSTDYLPYSEDLLDLVRAYWKDIGVKFEPKFVPNETRITHVIAGESDIGMWSADGGTESTARANYPIRLLPPWHWIDCCALAAYDWRMWLDSNGAQGSEPPEEIKKVYQLVQEWYDAPAGSEEYERLIKEVLTIDAQNMWYFGTVTSAPAIFGFTDAMANVPREEAVFNNGVTRPYLPDTWFVRQ